MDSKTGRKHLIGLLAAALCAAVVTTFSHAQTATAEQTGSASAQTADINPSDNVEAPTEEAGAESSPQVSPSSDSQPPESKTVRDQVGVFNIDVLVERMKQTDAIGVISKLSLKNKVDDLLEQANKIKTAEPDTDFSQAKLELRENFEGLILKTVALLNKGEDFALAEDIYLAREELWKSIMENKA